MDYTCLTCDLTGSRALPDRAGVQRAVEEALTEANAAFAERVVVPLTVVLGDEWQGLLAQPAAAIEIDFFLRDRLHSLGFASGIGVGELATEPRATTAQMDGACFHRSREALARAKSLRSPSTVVVSTSALFDGPVNAIYRLLHALSSTWTEKQLATLRAFVEEGTEARAAERLGVSQPTVHQSLDRSQAKPYLEGRTALLAFAEEYATVCRRA